MSKIVIDLKGATPQQTNRIRRIMEILLDQELFNMRKAKATLHFDHDGVLKVIDWETNKWRKEAFTTPVVLKAFESFNVSSLKSFHPCPNCGEPYKVV